jgi:hypothetical protein
MRTLSLLAFVLIICSFSEIKETKLEYTFKVGDQYDYVQTAKQSTKQEIPGMGEMKTDVNMDATMHFNILEVSAGVAKIEAAYTKFKMETSNPMANVKLDTDGADDNMQNKLVKAMMNKPFTFTITKAGKIEKFEGVENIYSGLGTLGLDANMLTQIKQGFQQTFSESSMRALLESGLVQYPDKKVKEGDTWSTTGELIMNFAGKLDNNWTLKKIEGDATSVEADGSISTTDPERVFNMGMVKMKSNLSGRQVMAGKTNINTGWPTEVKVLWELKGVTKLLAGGMIPQDMDVPTEIAQEATYTITKK